MFLAASHGFLDRSEKEGVREEIDGPGKDYPGVVSSLEAGNQQCVLASGVRVLGDGLVRLV